MLTTKEDGAQEPTRRTAGEAAGDGGKAARLDRAWPARLHLTTCYLSAGTTKVMITVHLRTRKDDSVDTYTNGLQFALLQLLYIYIYI